MTYAGRLLLLLLVVVVDLLASSRVALVVVVLEDASRVLTQTVAGPAVVLPATELLPLTAGLWSGGRRPTVVERAMEDVLLEADGGALEARDVLEGRASE